MFQPSTSGAAASTVYAGNANDPTFEAVRHMVFGSAPAVQAVIARLHHLNYAEPNDWSRPIATGQGDEVVVVLIKRVRVIS